MTSATTTSVPANTLLRKMKYTASTGRPPLSASQKKLMMPTLSPKVRIMFIVPGLPLPTSRMSRFLNCEIITAKLKQPTR